MLPLAQPLAKNHYGEYLINWIYEVANILDRALPDEASQKINLLLNLRISEIDCSEQMIGQCLAWMKEQQVTFYDAAYLAAAYATDAVLLTSDAKFLEKMKNDERICLLSEWGGVISGVIRDRAINNRKQ